MFDTIKIYGKKINCNNSFAKLKEDIEQEINQNEDFLENAKMECKSIVNGKFIDFNSNVASLLLSFSAFYLSLFEKEKIEMPILSFGVYVVGIVGIAVLMIRMHMKKQNAEKILYVIEKIEETPNKKKN